MPLTILRTVIVALSAISLAACFGPRTEPSGSLISRTLSAGNGQKNDGHADMLVLAASHMASGGHVAMLEDAVKSGEEAVRIYARSGNLRGVFKARMMQLGAYARLGRQVEAQRAADQAGDATRAAGCQACLAEVHLWRGKDAIDRGDRRRARGEFEVAAVVLEAEREFAKAADVWLSWSALALREGDPGAAASSVVQADRLARLSGDDRLLGRTLVQAAAVDTAAGRSAAAAGNLAGARSAFEKAGAHLDQVDTLCRLARMAGSAAETRRFRAAAETVVRSEPDRGAQAREWMLIAEEYYRIGDRETADRRFGDASAIYEASAQPVGLAAVETFRILLARQLNENEEAARRLPVARRHLATKPDRAKRTAPIVALTHPVGVVRMTLDLTEGSMLVEQRRYQESLDVLTSGSSLARGLSRHGSVAVAESLRAQALSALGQRQAAEQALVVALEAAKLEGDPGLVRTVETALRRARSAGG